MTLGGKVFSRSLGNFRVQATSEDSAWASEQLLPHLIDKPADHPVEQAGIYEDEDDTVYEMVDMEDVTLLKEAEKVVEEIQDVVDHIASYPPDREEVFTKIKAIVCQYRLFMDTEYYDAINSFVAVTVQRDCAINFPLHDLKALWYNEAA
jgi:hypothetical protein